METEAKAKVVASVLGPKCIQFLAALAVLPQSIWKKRLNSSYSSKSSVYALEPLYLSCAGWAQVRQVEVDVGAEQESQ